mmetsp:Transcript_20471/g.52017  ORF Transcript_20471/g.52017 Transcript_20471/m.52017 type:complete len:204 (+) Transcript_20471:513-1124(+)
MPQRSPLQGRTGNWHHRQHSVNHAVCQDGASAYLKAHRPAERQRNIQLLRSSGHGQGLGHSLDEGKRWQWVLPSSDQTWHEARTPGDIGIHEDGGQQRPALRRMEAVCGAELLVQVNKQQDARGNTLEPFEIQLNAFWRADARSVVPHHSQQKVLQGQVAALRCRVVRHDHPPAPTATRRRADGAAADGADAADLTSKLTRRQ